MMFSVFLICMGFVFVKGNTDNTTDFALRLINPLANKSKEGRLEIYYNGSWGTVCDDFFTDVSARVACASLGFGDMGAVTVNRYGPGTDSIWMDDVKCNGTENGIEQCSHHPWGTHDCTHREDVSINCGNATKAMRLNNSLGVNLKEGRLEIYYNGSWGTVCDDKFTTASARVACASLGFGYMGVVIGNRYGAGTGRIWLDDVNCTGTESFLERCTHNWWGVHNCHHDEDVSISCGNTRDFAIRLYNFFGNNSKEGRLEIYYSGKWGTVCDDFFTDVNAGVACASLGFGYIGAVIGNHYGPGTNQIWLDDVICVGTESGIDRCTHRGWGMHNCGHGEDVSISCGNTRVFAVRLSNSIGSNSKEGRLEIYYSGKWGTVCDDYFTNVNARVACVSLGFGDMGVVIGNRYGAGTGDIWLDDVNCTGTETGIQQCTHRPWGQHNCQHSEDVSVGCDCGDRNFTGRSGKISSPNFPLGYANGLDCNNYITATSVETIIITFLTFNTEPSSDWVTVTCDSGSTYTTPSYSGFELPPVLIIPACHSVKVYFHSDSSTTYTGFSLTYSMSTVCGERYYSGLSGKVSSPNYPMRYTNNLECYNYITVSHGQTVIVTFLNFNTESGFDWVQISCVSGNTITSPLYSGSQIPSVLTISSCRIVNVHFHTNNNVTDTGFSLTYNITVISGQNGSNTTAGSMVTVPTSRVPITTILTNANNATEPTTITVVPTTTGTATVQTTTSEAVVTTQVVTTPNSIDKFCDNETDTKYSIHWNRTIAGTNSSEPCPWNPTGWCSRECLPNTIWSQPTCNSCADKKFNDFFVRVNKLNLTALDNQNVTAKIASDLSTATNNSEGLTPGNLKASVELIKLLSDAIQRNDSNATINEMEIKSIVKAASNVLRPNNSESWETLKKENQNIATSILLSLDNYGRSLAALNISENRKEEENLILEAWSFEKSNLREIEFPSRSLWDEDRGDGISISVEALQSRMLSGRPTLNMWGSYYRTVNEYLPGHKDTDVVNSRVLSFSIDGLKTNEELKRPVIITLRHNQENRTGFQRKCAFWNFGSGTWDFDGCSVTLTNRTHTICSCNHLTNFAILMSLTPKEEDKLLSLISVIGCSISAAALILTILIYALTWKQSKSAQATVLLNLCVALASAYLIFLAGADKFGEEKYQDGCTAVAVLLHYFFLAAFFIMLIEGVELVLYIIFVFHVRRTRETIMLIVSAWVLPLIIVGVSLGSTRFDGYGHKNACWLSAEKGLIWAFIGPVLFIVTANFVILIVVLSWMSKKKALLAKNGKKRDEIRATIWNLSVTCPVLGLGWLFGVLNLISDDVFFQYLFVIVNSLQGLLIFIFHALFHNKKMNEKISSFYSNYICRCRKSKLSVSTQITSAQEQSTSTTAASKATIEMTSAQEQSTSTTAASKATIEMTSAQEQSTSSILALTATTEISSAQEQSTSSTPALTTITEMTLAQEQATSSTSVTKVSTEMSSAQEQSTSSTRASASTTEVTSSQEQSTSSTSTSKVTTEMSCDQEQSTSSTSAKDSSAANKKPTDKAKVVPRAVKYYEDLIGRAGQFAQRCSAAYDQWRL